ncbi:ribokinase [Spiroplasma endosymbiont of Othius punctulatus]|uniref:ribokinase n=1 Tax=Spiroplasma endosymbiont of Othius punctulatus TaxID=3066289 RepID=UPI0030D18295
MKKVLVIGSVNIDLVFTSPRLPLKGETLMGYEMNKFFGGKGANQAYALGRMNADVTMIGKVGDDEFGHGSIENLKSAGVKTQGVFVGDKQNTGMANIIVDDNGDNVILLVPGSNVEWKKGSLTSEHKKMIDECDIVVTQLEMDISFITEFIEYAHSKNKLIVLNPGPAQVLDKNLIKKCSLIVPNETELYTLMGLTYGEDINDLKVKAKEFVLEHGVALIVTMGSHGSIYIDKNETIEQSAYKVKAVDTTAAGDTFIGSYISEIAIGKAIKEALDFASRASSLTVSKPGAQVSIATRSDVEKFK